MTTPNQGEHAQTEAMYAAAMEFAAEKASISYVQRKCRCSYNDAERMLERMVSEGIIETYGGRKTVATTPSQPAAPQGVAEVNWWEANGDKYDASISPMQPAQGVAYAELPTSYTGSVLSSGRPDAGYAAKVTFTFNSVADAEAWHEAIIEPCGRASNGQAPAGASKFADVIAVQRSEAESDPSDAYMVGLYNGMSMMDANYRNITDWEPMGTVPKPTPTAQAAPAAGAVAGPSVTVGPVGLEWLIAEINKLPAVLAAEIDGEESDGTPRHWRDRPHVPLRKLERLLREFFAPPPVDAAPTPAAQADSQPAPVAAFEVADAMADSQYLAGVSAGWNAANADDPNAALQKLHESRAGYLKPLSAARAPAESVVLDAPAAGAVAGPNDLITIRKPTTRQEVEWLAKLAHLLLVDVNKTLDDLLAAAPTPAAQADSVLEDAARLELERICAAIKAEDDYCVEHGDYMLDSDDCIKIVRGEWVRPDFSVDAARKQGGTHD